VFGGDEKVYSLILFLIFLFYCKLFEKTPFAYN